MRARLDDGNWYTGATLYLTETKDNHERILFDDSGTHAWVHTRRTSRCEHACLLFPNCVQKGGFATAGWRVLRSFVDVHTICVHPCDP